MPLFVAGLAGGDARRKVPLYRVATILVGFAGTILMVRPGGGVFDPAALLALRGLRLWGRAADGPLRRGAGFARRALFHQNIVYLVVALVMALVFARVDLRAGVHPSLAFMVRPWAMPTHSALAFVLAMGPLVTASMYFFSLAYRIGPASFVAPFEYSGMIWAVVFGLVFWRDVPGTMTIIGGTLVASAGIIMLRLDARGRGAAGRSADGIAGPALDRPQRQRGDDAGNTGQARDAGAVDALIVPGVAGDVEDSRPHRSSGGIRVSPARAAPPARSGSMPPRSG